MSYVVKVDTREVSEALSAALVEAAAFTAEQIVEITPRDLKRMPQNIDRKD